jgi:hypothetical protein
MANWRGLNLASPGAIGGTTPAAGTFTKVTVTGGTTTTDNPIITGTQTWNDAGVTFTGYKINITSTASAAASKLVDWQVGGTSMFSVNKAGDITMGNGSVLTAVAGLELRYASGMQLVVRNGPTTEIVRFAASEGMQFLNGGYIQFKEQTAPAAPAADSVRLYAVDNGAGKTQLMALFSSGAAQQVAIQP